MTRNVARITERNNVKPMFWQVGLVVILGSLIAAIRANLGGCPGYATGINRGGNCGMSLESFWMPSAVANKSLSAFIGFCKFLATLLSVRPSLFRLPVFLLRRSSFAGLSIFSVNLFSGGGLIKSTLPFILTGLAAGFVSVLMLREFIKISKKFYLFTKRALLHTEFSESVAFCIESLASSAIALIAIFASSIFPKLANRLSLSALRAPFVYHISNYTTYQEGGVP